MSSVASGPNPIAPPPEAKHLVPEAVAVPRSRVIIASLVGTTIEFYDFYAYATAAVAVFPALYFTGQDDTAKLMASMATFATAFVGRPIGSIIFGHFGDRIGRKATLIGALLTMGVATFLIGCLPTYYQIGFWAPTMLTILRFCQGLGLGGEWSGASLLATEYAEPGRRARAAMWPQLGAPIGFFLANGFMLLITLGLHFTTVATSGRSHAFMVWGWRLPFLASLVIVLIGLYVRVRLEETPVFKAAESKGHTVGAPVAEVFRTSWKQLIQGTFIMLATYVLFYTMTAWVLSYGIGKVSAGGLGITYRSFLVLQLVAVLLFAAGVPVSGWLADRFGRRSSQLVITAVILLFGLTFKLIMDPARVGTGDHADTTRVLLFLCLGMILMGLTFGSMSAILPELFPTNVRYTGSGVAYNVASILGAAITPYVAVYLNHHWGVGAVGYYLSFACLITLVALWFSPETRGVDLYSVGDDVL